MPLFEPVKKGVPKCPYPKLLGRRRKKSPCRRITGRTGEVRNVRDV
jgi:hypothetical protein